MNRILTLTVIVAVVALLGFAVLVFTTGGPPPPLSSLSAPDQLQADQQPATPSAATPATPSTTSIPSIAAPAAPSDTTPEAAARFDAWAKPLRDGGLTVTPGSIRVSGETLSVAGLTIVGPDQLPAWRWTVQNASLFDHEPFHLQAAGETTLTLASGPDAAISWTGRVDAFGIAIQKDRRDVLSRSLVFRVNGLSLAGPGDSAPLTLGDGQLRLLLGGGTGLLPPGTKFTLRLTDMVVPAAAGTTLGSKVKSFTTEFALGQKLTGYSFPEVLGLFESGTDGAIDLASVGLDWGTLHFIGGGDVKLGRTGVIDGQLDVRITDVLPFLDAVSAAGAADAKALAETYAAVLLEMGSNPTAAALPFTIAIKAGAIALAGASRGVGDVALGLAPTIVTGVPPATGGSSDAAPAAPPAP